ncbi:sulfate adenylyltransferase subunit CysN [Acuticoccus sp. I52.16.1]|uniref:sulfate adenylyltransferase subunit CysN n=1 Tax=Acuticoccus sp. I52.16.1 TaxID=2928472 RepID=UPI001FD39EEC|nr:sulfate adenylyltransferase subunit CysN [Acuticoccus sp. I52.16.1]UOM36355.1 sulfate adenylyltransferase subunit CysN [Acuticoccus sp. I52.16.1]
MSVAENLSPEAFSEYLASQEKKSFLRFITCGSVDDGKSTLIGRLLFESKLIFEDQLAAVERDSRRHGTTGEDIDLALLVDGLEAERQQGITIDVAYRFFTTDKRKFIVADTPGHEQYTRNMATGASTADLAVLLVDARNGIQIQTKRHAFLVSLLGIRHVVLAVNKIDLVDFSEDRYNEIRAEFEKFAHGFDFDTMQAIPISARYGDNVIARSEKMGWYQGPTLLDYLESVEVQSDLEERPFRMSVQWVNRPNLNFRGFSGTIASGKLRPGDPVVVANSGKDAIVKRIVTMDGDLAEAGASEAVTVVLDREIDVSRGDILVPPSHRPEVADQFAAHIVWMAEEKLYPGRPYILKIGNKTVSASVTEIKHRIDVNTFDHLAAKDLGLNEVGFCNVSLSADIAFDPYEANRDTGAFILVDRLTNATVGAGMVWFALRRATNIHWQATDVNKETRAAMKGQKPAILWFTGLSGSGKSTIGNLVEKRLSAMGRHTYILDGDNVRHGLNRDLGFTDADRVENIRRVAETAKLFVDAGLLVCVTFISPFRSERRMARELVGEGEFLEVYIDTPIEECRRRDPKGLYKKADSGQLKNFTGIDSPYEAPEHAEISIDTTTGDPEAHAERIVDLLKARGIIE